LLGVGAVTAAFAWGVTASVGILLLASLFTWIAPGTRVSTQWLAIISLAAGLSVAAFFIWRARHVVSFARVALWIEESLPRLQYSLVTAIEPERSAFAQGIESSVEREDISGVASRAFRRAVLPAIAAAVVAGLLLYVVPSSALSRGGLLGRLGGAGGNSSAPLGSRLEKVSVDLTPPSYTGEKTTTLDDPSSVTALIGSRLVVRGDGSSGGVTADLGASAVQMQSSRGGWAVAVAMPAKPAALTLHDRQFERIIVLDPRTDAPPKIVLTSPTRDTTMRVAKLVLHLNAAVTDDIGLSGAYFEYLVTTGSG
jgi:hypothetical protein